MADSPPIKPLVAPDAVLSMLQAYFGRPILDLHVVPGGQVAQTFSFTVPSKRREEPASGRPSQGGEDYIVQFNATMLVNFEKEAYVYEHFASPTIRIPRVVHLGRLGQVHFAISQKLPGLDLLHIARPEYLALIPRLTEVLDAIHRAPLGDRAGYGIFDGRGVGMWPSWKAHLEYVREEEPPGDFYESWHTLFQTSFLERDVFEHLYGEMLHRIGFCPEERALVHGGYGFGNVLAQAGQITGVLDWMDARYGDFLYDVAWLDFWSPEDKWQSRFWEHYERTETAVPGYRERILCYQCYIALDGLKFSAKAGNRALYDHVKQRIAALLPGS